MIGSRLAHYTVVSPLGAGGMGEVWRATDGRLGRDVALKLLPASVARDPERLARFQREAQLLASLNHPHIGAIYGFEAVGDARFLVLELVEGPTLADRIAAGPLPVDEALPIALQIAEAVEAAHEKGIVHRDLKPANVKVTPDGRVKVLDFGLAKALVDDPSSSGSISGTGSSPSRAADLTQSPTMAPGLGASVTSPAITDARTAAHVILGTAAYMAPEQARGQAVDRRADIWALGVVLWEMLTGERLFAGETVSDTLAAVLKTDPDFDALPADTPPRVRRLLRRCLVRNPRERLRDAGDARILLREAIAGAPDEAPAPAPSGPTARAPRRWLLPAAVTVAAAIGAGAMAFLRPGAPEPAPRRFFLPIRGDVTPSALALAPDGSALAVLTGGRLEVRDFRTGGTRVLDEVSGAEGMFWSADAEWIAYGAHDELRKVRRTGGESALVSALSSIQRFTSVGGGVWDANGRITFASGSGGIYSVPAQGGQAQEIIPPGDGETDYHGLAALPGDRGWLTILHGREAFDTILAVDRDGARTTVLHLPGQNVYDVSWSPTGHVVFRRAGTNPGVWAIRYSPASGKTEGEPILLAADAVSPTVAMDGTLAYGHALAAGMSSLVLFDREGNALRAVGDPGQYFHFPALSPDGSTVAVRMTEGETRNLWLVDVERGVRRRFTSGPARHNYGQWDAAGKEIWYYEGDADAGKVFVRAANGAGEPRFVVDGVDPQPTPDGSRLFFLHIPAGSFDVDLWTLDLSAPDAQPQPFVATDAVEISFAVHPTRPLIAYSSESSGRAEIYLTTYPGITDTWPVSTTGGHNPRWRADGRELFWACADSIMAVDVDPADGASVRLGRPRLLFRRPDYRPSVGSLLADGFAVTADGSRFVVCVPSKPDEANPPAIVIAQHWAGEI